MPDERMRAEQVHSPDSADATRAPMPPNRLLDRVAASMATWPWWSITLVILAVGVLYAMSTSAIYNDIIRQLSDDPHASTDDLYEVVQIVGKPSMIIGTFSGESQDTVPTVINDVLKNVIDSPLVTRSGFIESMTPASITVSTDEGALTIPRHFIEAIEPPGATLGEEVTVSYIDQITVAGIMTDQDDDTMTVRIVNPESETFPVSRILSRETALITCDKQADPDCEDRELVTIERQGEIVSGRLTTLSNTGLAMQDTNDKKREFRLNELEYLHVPTLTVAVNAALSAEPVQPGQEVRIGFAEGTDVVAAFGALKSLDNVPVPLRHVFDDVAVARVVLVPYPDVPALLAATAAGEVAGLVYLDGGPDRMGIADWVEANPDAGIVLAGEARECTRSCEITLKVLDDVVAGIVLNETPDEITIRTVEPENVVIDRAQIIENRRMEPDVCALNNLAGCNAGIFLTLKVTVFAYGLALLIGLFVGLMRVSNNPVIYALSTLYVEVVRGIPLLVILLYAGFVVSPEIRDNTPFELSDEQEAIIGLAFGYGAFVAEIFRAGIQSISRGQMEAARSLGMSYPQSMRFVILPQAVRVVLPPLGNDFISMLKDSALISVLALPDLLQLGRLHISRTFRAFEGYNTVAMMYLTMTLFLSLIVRIIERRSALPR